MMGPNTARGGPIFTDSRGIWEEHEEHEEREEHDELTREKGRKQTHKHDTRPVGLVGGHRSNTTLRKGKLGQDAP